MALAVGRNLHRAGQALVTDQKAASAVHASTASYSRQASVVGGIAVLITLLTWGALAVEGSIELWRHPLQCYSGYVRARHRLFIIAAAAGVPAAWLGYGAVRRLNVAVTSVAADGAGYDNGTALRAAQGLRRTGLGLRAACTALMLAFAVMIGTGFRAAGMF